jgi:myo-inositol-1(or 4)-monophosphatase
MSMTQDLALAKTAALAAGDVLMDHWRKRGALTITTKRKGDFVSEADLAAENTIRDILLGAHPADGWLGEETAASSGQRRWIVDPLDGTTNFLRGIPHWAISIALEVDGRRVLGVVHDPVKGETFHAATGQGAWLNDAGLVPGDGDDLSQALFGTGIPFGGMDHIDAHAADIARLMPHCAGVRRFGAAALDLAYVAAGRLDGFWERRLQQWDIAAGLVILAEAGVKISTFAPDDRPELSGDVICAAAPLHDSFRAILLGQSGNRA